MARREWIRRKMGDPGAVSPIDAEPGSFLPIGPAGGDGVHSC